MFNGKNSVLTNEIKIEPDKEILIKNEKDKKKYKEIKNRLKKIIFDKIDEIDKKNPNNQISSIYDYNNDLNKYKVLEEDNDVKYYKKITQALLKYKVDKLEFKFENDHCVVKEKGQSEETALKFYFYSFADKIEDFNKEGFKELHKVEASKEKSLSSICVDNKNNVLTNHYKWHSPFAVGCNFLINNATIISHDNVATWSNWRYEEQYNVLYGFKQPLDGKTIINEHISAAKDANIDHVKAILANRFFKQKNFYKKKTKVSMLRFDEIKLGTKQASQYFNIKGFCLYLNFVGGTDFTKPKKGIKIDEYREQIKKVVEANNKLGITEINIIDYSNKPSFITIPNKVECIEKYISHRNQNKNFDEKYIKNMWKKEEAKQRLEQDVKKHFRFTENLKHSDNETKKIYEHFRDGIIGEKNKQLDFKKYIKNEKKVDKNNNFVQHRSEFATNLSIKHNNKYVKKEFKKNDVRLKKENVNYTKIREVIDNYRAEKNTNIDKKTGKKMI